MASSKTAKRFEGAARTSAVGCLQRGHRLRPRGTGLARLLPFALWPRVELGGSLVLLLHHVLVALRDVRALDPGLGLFGEVGRWGGLVRAPDTRGTHEEQNGE